MLQLIEAAEHVFLSKGYHAATMSDVAKQAGMSKKTVYAMIDSKAELFSALLNHHQALLSFPVMAPDTPMREILNAYLLSLARFLLAPKQVAILRLIMTEYTHSPELSRIFVHQRVAKAKTKLEGCFANLLPEQNPLSLSPKDMAAMLFGMAIGEFHTGVLIGFRATPSKAVLEKRITQAVDLFLAGCQGEARS